MQEITQFFQRNVLTMAMAVLPAMAMGQKAAPAKKPADKFYERLDPALCMYWLQDRARLHFIENNKDKESGVDRTVFEVLPNQLSNSEHSLHVEAIDKNKDGVLGNEGDLVSYTYFDYNGKAFEYLVQEDGTAFIVPQNYVANMQDANDRLHFADSSLTQSQSEQQNQSAPTNAQKVLIQMREMANADREYLGRQQIIAAGTAPSLKNVLRDYGMIGGLD